MSSVQIDYYELLEVTRDADGETIKRAFRRKARTLHPDVNDASDAEDRFKELNEAYDILSDPSKRSHYDRFGTAPGAGGGAYSSDFGDIFGGAVDLGDLFSSFFGGVAGGRGRQQARPEGRDMAIGIAISLEDAARGVTRQITIDRLAPCDQCDATGSADKAAPTTCPTCDGAGQVVAHQQTIFGTMRTQQPCPDCGGTGQVVQNPCDECQGSGRVIDRQTIDVEIPAGIADGQKIRVARMGEAGIRGAASGDLLVTIHVQAHDRFVRKGQHLNVRLPLSIAEATLGATKRIEGLLGEVVVEVPAGVQTGDRVSVDRAGLPFIKRPSETGKLYCHVDVVVPTKPSKRAEELLRELSAELGDSETSDADDLLVHNFGDKVKDFFRGSK
ncbi:MAG: J domain-containing protein [Coriobacteriia bacterium]|nr:J domain-containing protein [Coriobacteriia bacterium]MCL2537435.1 J domain-containing protein [Coriobacteriia bacterium]